QYRSSKNNALKWLEQYPQDSLKADILILLGKDFNALGNKPQAFYWWLKAKEEYPDNIRRQEELNKELDELVRTSKIEELERISEYAAESYYAPKIYHRIATFFVDQNELEKAQKAAMSLVQSTTENSWILIGRQLLERIQGEMAVRPNVVGCLLPLSGPFAIYGEEILNGIQLGMATFGEKGQDSDLELVIKDTKGTPEDTLAGLENLVINEKVMAIIGPLLSSTAISAAKKAQRLGVPIITLTQKEGIMEEGDMVFRNFLTPSQEVKRLLNTAIVEMGIKRFGVLYPDNSYGRFFMNLFRDKLEEMGAKVTAIESYNPDDTDFANPIKKMIGLYYPRPASLVQKLIEMRSIEEEENEIFPEEPEPII
ncbi:MAG: penicillin-binding protein activator, partial [Deltaproteobacteria bacterium]|nr:penicillin-binding protein activator [Deltaproteobacteria bacterium]